MKIKKKLTVDEIRNLKIPCECWDEQGFKIIILDKTDDGCAIKCLKPDDTFYAYDISNPYYIASHYLFEVEEPRMKSRYRFTDLKTFYTFDSVAYYTENGEYEINKIIDYKFDSIKYKREKIGEEIPCEW